MRLSHLTQAVAFVTATLILTACGNDSDTTTEIIDGTPPLLTTDSNFSTGDSAVAAMFVSGQVQDSSGIKSLTYALNKKSAQLLKVDTDGYFSDRILLDLGSNTITLEATDNAGNIMRSTKTIYLGDTIAAGGSHTGALRDGQLYGWGRNNYGQTGLVLTSKIADTMGHPNTPMLMNSAPNNLLSIKFNQNHSLAIDDKGLVYSWGEDISGQLGRGSTGRNDCSKTADCRLDIGAIAGIENAVMVAAGYKHNLVLTKDGNVWAFGANGQGQLGNSTSIDSSTPVKVDFSASDGVGHIVQVVASASSSYALDDKGQVWGWGSDAYANLGRGQECNKVNNCININATPVLINVINTNPADANIAQGLEAEKEIKKEKVTQLAAGRDHVLALTNKESVYAWGLNATSQVGYNGELFSGTEKAWANTVTTPTKLPWFADKDIRRVYANGNASYALLDKVASSNGSSTDGLLYAWGMFGETDSKGKTVYDDLDEPTNKLPNLKNISNMAMGAMHLIAQEKPLNQDHSTPAKNGDLFTWGWSFEGSLGSKDAAHIWMYNTPIPVNLPSQL
ncbi:chromosome condensation regulator RCC1 [Psychrobacter sp. DAB_AL32B]|uniref:RCC1 domain-containing protein n=1 Tax=Psychrobacter sp. DAB_AL32B TaxID=1028414 RepID=UPI000B7E307E|nr:chromosome condensation regulator RCC1 [Psychrobacter sp. DAB_AL32B]OXL26182.1 chromosome condensation regulator RCC1 [Psychrobacter sp. DAB_AL32B]